MDNIKNPYIQLPQKPIQDEQHVWHLFVIRTKQREKLQEHLVNQGVQILVHYPIAPHKQQAYGEFNHLSFPITEQIHQEVLSLPISPVMTMDDVKKVVNACNQFNE